MNSSVSRHRKLPPLTALRAFEAAARHLSFRQAAEELAVTPTAISHQIRQLEEILGVPLFLRQVRSIALTPQGEALYPVLRDGFDRFEQTLRSLPPRKPRVAVTMTATTLLTARRLLPALPAFRALYPAYDLRFHAADEVVDLRTGVADVAIRYGGGPQEGYVTEPLLSDRYGVLCSPVLGVKTPEDLRRVPLMHTVWKQSAKSPDWKRWAEQAGLPVNALCQTVSFHEDGHALQAAIAGHGAVIASLVLAQAEIEAGLLVHPFGPEIPGEEYALVASAEMLACEDVQAVRSWLRAVIGGKSGEPSVGESFD